MKGFTILTSLFLTLFGLQISEGALQSVTFDGRFSYEVVDESKLDATKMADLADPKNTGTKLFNTAATDKNKKLSAHVFIKDYKSVKSSYFRAHPVFINCVDKVFSQLDRSDAGHRLLLDSGFKTKSEASGGEHDLYARAGTAVIIKYRLDSKVKDVLDIAKEVLKHCPFMFASIQRDLGVVLMTDGVGFHMRGSDDKQPYFGSNGGKMSTTDFKKWCLDKIDEGFETGPKPTNCKATGLNNGETYPKGAKSPEEVVGRLDMPVTRKDKEDFKRLVQFIGRVIEFENSEATSSWCGAVGTPCRPCSDGIFGSELDSRCADRVMAPRMYMAMNKLQYLVRKGMNDKLVVTEAWDEPHSAATSGDSPAESLHREGRQVKAKLKNAGSLTDLTKYAICAGMDYVEHNGASVTFAVRKQESVLERKVRFSDANMELLVVALPSARQEKYKLPAIFSEKDILSMPIFYADHQDTAKLADDFTFGMFRSGETCTGTPDCPDEDDDTRYFRLNPGIVRCYSLINDKVKKEFKKTLKVVKGYRSTQEWDRETDSLLDDRGSATTYGEAMHINFPGFTPHRLAEIAVDQCAKIFYADEQQEMGIGLYKDHLYIDIRDEIYVWVEEVDLLPKGWSIEKFEDKLAERFEQNILGQRIDPDDLEVVCQNADPPQPQSPSYKHQHSAAVRQNIRQRRAAPIDGECVPKSDTKFCKDTDGHRKNVVSDVWKEITRKYHSKDIIEIKKALDGCLGACGTCLEGAVWEDKIENCENLIHWIAFETLNNDKESHFYSSDNVETRRFAYANHCVDRSALYGLLAASVKTLYRPDPKRSVEEELYSPENNPSPLMDLIKRLYAFYARGTVTMWMKDDIEATSMKNVLKVLMAYNKNVTDIKVMVPTKEAAGTVGAVLENSVAEWVKSSCTRYSREFITPFRIIPGWPQSRKKRDTEEDVDFGEKFRKERVDWEKNWIENQFSP